jgi:hypothetical protein
MDESVLTPVPAVRPCLLDRRFAGDPWVVTDDDGIASVCLDSYSLTRLSFVELDLPSLNTVWTYLRHHSQYQRQ